MSVVPTIFNGLKGKADANTLGSIPSTGAPNDTVHKPVTKLNYYTLKGNKPNCMDQSVLLTNDSGSRGVKPCKGVHTAVNILRRPAISSLGGIYPHTGFTRGQQPGLLTQRDIPTNLPIMPQASSFNAGLRCNIPNLPG